MTTRISLGWSDDAFSPVPCPVVALGAVAYAILPEQPSYLLWFLPSHSPCMLFTCLINQRSADQIIGLQ
jgi:hypothetical protein